MSGPPDRLGRDDLDLLHGLAHDAWSQPGGVPLGDQRRLGELAVLAHGEVQELRWLTGELRDLLAVADAATDALAATSDPTAVLGWFRDLKRELHRVAVHGGAPDRHTTRRLARTVRGAAGRSP